MHHPPEWSKTAMLVALLAGEASACTATHGGGVLSKQDSGSVDGTAPPFTDAPSGGCSGGTCVHVDAGERVVHLDAGSRSPTDAASPSVDAAEDARLPDAPTRGPVFTPHVGLDPGGLARPIGAEFSVSGSTLQTSGDGRSWLLWTSYASPDFSSTTAHLDHFDVDGAKLGSSPMETVVPDGFVLHESGSLTGWRGYCHETNATCLYQDPRGPGSTAELVWSPVQQAVTTRQLDWNGDLVSTADVDIERRVLMSATAAGDGLYALTNEGATRVHYLDGNGASVWSIEVFPRVLAPPSSIDAPTDELIRGALLTLQSTSKIVRTEDGVVVAAAVARGTLAALAASSGVVLPLPDDPLCSDVVVAHVSSGGQAVRYWSIPTPECETLPELAVAAGHAVIASTIPVAIPPVPNDTSQYDIALAVLDLSTGGALHTTISMNEDDIVEAMAPCGDGAVCLAGMTGTRSVDTGSRVTYGDGFVLPVSLAGTVGARWSLHSDRHTTIPLLAPRDDGSVLFFATVDGPITHTADGNPSLRYNAGLLGVVPGQMITVR